MSKTLKIGVIGLLVVAAVATIAAAPAFAQDDPPGGQGPGPRHGQGTGLLEIDQEALHASLASELGISPDAFEAARAEGTSLVQLADENAVDITDLRAVMDDFRSEAIAQALEAGLITQDQADRMLERSGFGSGNGHGECDGTGKGPFGPGARGRSGPRAGNF